MLPSQWVALAPLRGKMPAAARQAIQTTDLVLVGVIHLAECEMLKTWGYALSIGAVLFIKT